MLRSIFSLEGPVAQSVFGGDNFVLWGTWAVRAKGFVRLPFGRYHREFGWSFPTFSMSHSSIRFWAEPLSCVPAEPAC